MNRQHEVVVAEGSFRVVLTPQNRLMAVINAPNTVLGPLHIAIEVDRGIHPDVLRRHALAQRGLHPPYIEVGGIFGDIGKFIGRAAEGAFNGVSKVATTIAKPVFTVTNSAISQAMGAIAKATPLLPSKVRNQISSAARVVAKARLGDVTAKQFVRTIAQAAKAGVAGARKIGDALLDGSKLVAKVVDLPMHVLRKVPGVGNVVQSISPFQKFDKMVGAIQRGDLKSLKEMLKGDLSMAQGIISLVPGIGTGVSAGISAGLAALEGGSPLLIALRAAYGAIPIPIGIRTVTDAILASVIELAQGGRVTDVALAAAREKVPSGIARDVFDTLVHIIVKRVPVQKAAGALASHYVNQYAGQAGSHLLGQAQRQLAPQLASLGRIAVPVGSASRILRPVFRPMAVAGEEPVAYDVAGDYADYEVAGEWPVAGYEVAGDDDGVYDALEVAGEEELDFDVGGESDALGSVVLPPEVIASLANASEWRSMRSA